MSTIAHALSFHAILRSLFSRRSTTDTGWLAGIADDIRRFDHTGLRPDEVESKPVTYPAEPWGGVHQHAPFDKIVVSSAADRKRYEQLPPAKAGGQGVGTFLGPAEEWHHNHVVEKGVVSPVSPTMTRKGPQNGADEGFGIPY